MPARRSVYADHCGNHRGDRLRAEGKLCGEAGAAVQAGRERRGVAEGERRVHAGGVDRGAGGAGGDRGAGSDRFCGSRGVGKEVAEEVAGA